MKILLDTHVFLWAMLTPEKLGEEAVELLADANYDKYLSAVSAWEITIKHAKGKIALPVPPKEFVTDSIAAAGILQLPVTIQDAFVLADLPYHHDDLFDRQLIAQAQRNQMFIMTDETVFERYDVKIINI